MHQMKSEVQIGKETSGVSSDFNPTPPYTPSSLTQKNQNFNFNSITPQLLNNSDLEILIGGEGQQLPEQNDSVAFKRPFKRPHLQRQFSCSLAKDPTLNTSLDRYGVSVQNQNTTPSKFDFLYNRSHKFFTHFHHHLRYLRRRVHLHLRLILLLSLPFFYFLVSHPSTSLILDFLSAFAFVSVLFFSLNLAIPRLPTIRLFLSKNLPLRICSKSQVARPHLPVFWSIGSRQKTDKRIISGYYVQAYSNGDVYEGEFHQGKSSGSGVYYYYMSGRYEGDWVEGKYDGYGVETWARGSRYRGQYGHGLRHGFGVYRFYTGDVYAGEWSNGQSHGCGIHTCDDGSRYAGEFKWGVKHGHGHYHFRNGDRYAGEYFADKMHGFGIYSFANGHRYEGAWHEGKRQGLGMYTFRNGESHSGHWQGGILDIPSTQSIDSPVSPIAVNHSKVLNVLQEARRAAEKAYDVNKVDERVNRAVTAANRAANAARVAAVKAVQRQMPHRHDSDSNPHALTCHKFSQPDFRK